MSCFFGYPLLFSPSRTFIRRQLTPSFSPSPVLRPCLLLSSPLPRSSFEGSPPLGDYYQQGQHRSPLRDLEGAAPGAVGGVSGGKRFREG